MDTVTLRPRVVDRDVDEAFRALAARRGFDPDARFVGGYVDWEWSHARHVFDGLVEPARGREVLELGCNLGATAIVLAALGAVVTAVDPNASLLDLATLNAARHGLAPRIRFLHVPDTTRLPFEDACFSWVSCNSVLEYVRPGELPGVLREIDRVLRPGGIAAILGSSNRLWPREDHSRRWLTNYLPRGIAPGVPRGISVIAIRAVLRDYDDLTRADRGRLYVEMKTRMGAGGWKLAALRRASWALAAAGISPGALAPTLALLLRKR